MQARHIPFIRVAETSLIVLATFAMSCREGDQPTAPQMQAAKGGATTVTSVAPDNAKRGLNLDISVTGSGFDQGSVVALERQGVPASGITTNSTTFITPVKLIANITIAATADTGKYDVTVTTSGGRKGVGIELFDVLYQLVNVGVIAGNWSVATAINDLGQVVGTSCVTQCQGGTIDPPPSPAHAFFWTETGGIEDLGTLPGNSRSAAYDINNLGQVLGDVGCFITDPGCSGFSGEVVLWQKVGPQWTTTRLGIPLPNSGFSEGDLNNSGQFIMNGSMYSLTGGAAVPEPLPALDPPPGFVRALAINDAGIVAGLSGDNSGKGEALVWFRDQAGSWRILRLGALPGDNVSSAQDIAEVDAAGRIWVVGRSARTGVLHLRSHRISHSQPVRWTLESDGAGGWRVAEIDALQLPGRLPIGWSAAVNAAGEVAGYYLNRQIIYDAAKWLATGSVETLPSPSFGNARARDIDDGGEIVGSVWDDVTGSERAALWRLQ